MNAPPQRFEFDAAANKRLTVLGHATNMFGMLGRRLRELREIHQLSRVAAIESYLRLAKVERSADSEHRDSALELAEYDYEMAHNIYIGDLLQFEAALDSYRAAEDEINELYKQYGIE